MSQSVGFGHKSRNERGLGKAKFIISTGPRARRVPETAYNTGPHGKNRMVRRQKTRMSQCRS
jgi:hypothetical protein